MSFPPLPPADEINLLVSEEIQQIDGYEQIFVRTHPKPVKHIPVPTPAVKLTFKAMVGQEAVFFLTSAAGGAVLAAIRTGAIFYASELALLVGLNAPEGVAQTLAAVAGVATLFAVEGYLLAYGYYKGKESGQLNTNKWGVGIAFAISALAGIASSMPLVTEDTTNVLLTLFIDLLNWSLIIVSGVGATVLVYLGTENIGVLNNKWQVLLKEDEKRYQIALEEADDEYQTALDKWNVDLQKDYREKGRDLLFNKGRFVSPRGGSKDPRPQRGGDVSIQKLVEAWLLEHNLTADDVGIGKAIEPSAIAAELNVDAGNVRTALSRIRNK